MPDEARHESADLEDYSTQEPADSLTGEPGEPGDDPLDRGVAPPERWSSVIRSGSDGGEQESLDQLLAEEEPDTAFDVDDDLPEDRDDADEAEEPGWTLSADSTVIRVHQHAAGARHALPAGRIPGGKTPSPPDQSQESAVPCPAGAACRCLLAAAGRVTCTSSPPSGPARASAWPPCAWATEATMDRPRPAPGR